MERSTLRLDARLKDVAPSAALRKWFGHDPDRFAQFANRFRRELARSPEKEAVAGLIHRADEASMTLV
ncbi:MAG TPA: DUF488 family protein [Myxococcales bacterium]|nr:DUF488 family protein [Myxococcales bacterium]